MFIKQHFLFVYRSPKFRVHERGEILFSDTFASVGHAHPQSPVQGSHKPNSCHQCHQRCPLCAEEPYVQRRSWTKSASQKFLLLLKVTFCLLLLIEFSLNTVAIILCQSLRPQLKLILWKSRFELFVNITSIRLGEPFFVKHVGSLMRFVKRLTSLLRFVNRLTSLLSTSQRRCH